MQGKVILINPLVVPPTHVKTVAIFGTNSAAVNYENIITQVRIQCFNLLSFTSFGYKSPNNPSLAGLAVNGAAGINYNPIAKIATITAGVY